MCLTEDGPGDIAGNEDLRETECATEVFRESFGLVFSILTNTSNRELIDCDR